MKRLNLYSGLFLLLIIIISLFTSTFFKYTHFLEGLEGENPVDSLYNANIRKISNAITRTLNNFTPSDFININNNLNRSLNIITYSKIYQNFSITNSDVTFITDIISKITDENTKIISNVIDKLIYILREFKEKLDDNRSYNRGVDY